MCRIYLQRSWLSKKTRKASAAIVNLQVCKQTVNKSPQIANLHIFGLIPLSQIRKFLKFASPQIRFFINPKIANPHIFTKYCTSLSPKSHESHIFSYVQILITALHLCYIFVRRKKCICGLAEVRKSQTRLGPKICKVSYLRKVRDSNKLFKSATLRYLFADRPPLLNFKNSS